MQKSYAIKFVIMFGVLLAMAALMAVRANEAHQNFVDFSSIPSSGVFVEHGLTRSQIGSIKLRYQEKTEPPQIGLFGNHAFQFFSEDSLRRNGVNRTFFNYWFGNISFTEILIVLEHLENLGKLPTQHIIVGVTSPTNNNGRYIVGYFGEMPDWILEDTNNSGKSVHQNGIVPNIRLQLGAIASWLKRAFDYNSFLSGLFAHDTFNRIVDLGECEFESDPNFLQQTIDQIPVTIRQLLTTFGVQNIHCNPLQWKETLGSDGARDEAYTPSNPIIDQKPYDASLYALRPEDAKRIAEVINALEALARRNDRTITFIVQPVYESNRYRVSPMNKIFSKALESLDGIQLIDDRSLRNRRDFFVDYDHLNTNYYDDLIQRMGHFLRAR